MKQVGYRKTCLFDIENLDQNRPQKSAQISNLTGRPCGSCILLTVPPCRHPAPSTCSTVYGLSWAVYVDQIEEISSVFYLCLSGLGMYSKLLYEKCKLTTFLIGLQCQLLWSLKHSSEDHLSVGVHSSSLPLLLPARLFQHRRFQTPFHVPLPSALSRLLVLLVLASFSSLRAL